MEMKKASNYYYLNIKPLYYEGCREKTPNHFKNIKHNVSDKKCPLECKEAHELTL